MDIVTAVRLICLGLLVAYAFYRLLLWWEGGGAGDTVLPRKQAIVLDPAVARHLHRGALRLRLWSDEGDCAVVKKWEMTERSLRLLEVCNERPARYVTLEVVAVDGASYRYPIRVRESA